MESPRHEDPTPTIRIRCNDTAIVQHEDRFDLTGDGLVWYARPQLFFNKFNCTLCPKGLKASVHSGSHKEVSLVNFSTFEPIDLTPGSIMQRAGVPMLYDSASNPRLPCLYICPVAMVVD